ncbi:MAG: Rpn family recombination-promoting nuclease/putative transposase [Magnetococcales bacterium]|nr:Rpn family recombination-promoting nuclease/putative transposase [Magnetococcales bacterium]
MSNDATYHKLFSHPPMVADLLRHFVDPEVVAQLDLERMERVNAKFHAEGDERREGDVIWRIPMRDGSAVYLYLPAEFQSTVDPWMAVRRRARITCTDCAGFWPVRKAGKWAHMSICNHFPNDADGPKDKQDVQVILARLLRVLVYIGLLWQQLIREKRLGPDGSLPPVFPIVLYNGDPPWTVPVGLRELIRLPEGSSLWHFQPELRYHLLDEGRFTLAELENRASLSAMLFRLEHCHDPATLSALLDDLIGWFENHPDFAGIKKTMAGLAGQITTRLGANQNHTVTENLLEIKTMVETRAEEWIQGWLKQGRQEGVLLGRQEGALLGRQEGESLILLRQMRRRFGELPEWVAAKVNAADTERLEIWSDRILEAKSLEEIFSQ